MTSYITIKEKEFKKVCLGKKFHLFYFFFSMFFKKWTYYEMQNTEDKVFF